MKMRLCGKDNRQRFIASISAQLRCYRKILHSWNFVLMKYYGKLSFKNVFLRLCIPPESHYILKILVFNFDRMRTETASCYTKTES